MHEILERGKSGNVVKCSKKHLFHFHRSLEPGDRVVIEFDKGSDIHKQGWDEIV